MGIQAVDFPSSTAMLAAMSAAGSADHSNSTRAGAEICLVSLYRCGDAEFVENTVLNITSTRREI